VILPIEHLDSAAPHVALNVLNVMCVWTSFVPQDPGQLYASDLATCRSVLGTNLHTYFEVVHFLQMRLIRLPACLHPAIDFHSLLCEGMHTCVEVICVWMLLTLWLLRLQGRLEALLKMEVVPEPPTSLFVPDWSIVAREASLD
jgi:hypothetical protein